MLEKSVKQLLTTHEGLRLFPYRCPVGRLTIGIGRNLEDKGITKEEANFLLDNDIKEVLLDLEYIFPDLASYPEQLQLVLMDMRFNLGPGRFRTFENMIAAVKQRNYRKMLNEMVDSAWYDQVGQRSSNLVSLISEIA